MNKFDFIVVGSGFGGAVVACRIAQAGQSVLVLERGRWWDEKDYPSVTDRDWIFDVDEPERQNGWMDLRCFKDMAVVQGAGVGGGSLIYANVSVPPPEATFDSGWPSNIDAKELAPFVETVGQMLEVATIPDVQRTRRWDFVRRGSEKLGHLNRFSSLPLAVQFNQKYNPEKLSDPHDERHAVTRRNKAGVEQKTCIHLGLCDTGCPVKAKNTLDLNYLVYAARNGAEIRPLHIVRYVTPEDSGWRVHYEQIKNGMKCLGSVASDRVVLSAGSLGSTEILLRSRLEGVSNRLGFGWSPNGDFLTPATSRKPANPTIGPTITASIDHTDGAVYGQHIFIQDGGLPDLLRMKVSRWQSGLPGVWRNLFTEFLNSLYQRNPLEYIMPWFAQGIDASDGRLYLRRRYLNGLVGPIRLALNWDVDASKQTIDAIIKAHKELATVTDSKAIVPLYWTILRKLITPHPLGGCNMAEDAKLGVVDHAGRVFGVNGLYVVDGSIVPKAIGRNPSRTIAALAERAVEQWCMHELKQCTRTESR